MNLCGKSLGSALTGIFLAANALAQERTRPEFLNLEIQISMLRPGEVKAYATELRSKPGSQPRFRFGKANASWELTWSFVERSDFGDIYKFTRVGPAEKKEREISQREVVYTGRETVIWQDEEQRIVLKPHPASED